MVPAGQIHLAPGLVEIRMQPEGLAKLAADRMHRVERSERVLVGLAAGLFLTVVHRDCVDTQRPRYDPIIGHDWLRVQPLSAPVRGRRVAQGDAEPAPAE